VLIRNEYVLNVRTSEFEDMGYSLKRDGWLNNFVDVKNQSLRGDGVPWRGAREKRSEFFSIFFSALTDKDDIIMDWQCGVGVFFIFLFVDFSFVLLFTFFIFHLFSYPYLSAIGCTRRFRRCMPLHSMPYCGVGVGHRHLQVHPPPHA
jgi:hypothetical protein